MRRSVFLLAPSLVLATLSGCMVGPDYKKPPPATESAQAYKELTVTKEVMPGIEFRPALPRDTIDRGPWWTIYGDPTLDQLMAQIDVSNQTLKENEAAYRLAIATMRQNQSQLFPTLGYTGSVQQVSGRTSGSASASSSSGSSTGQYSLGGSLTWEIDVWGRIRRQIESDAAAAQASAADIAAARLSIQSSLVTSYFSLRISDDRAKFYREQVDALARSLQIVRNQVAAGTASKLDEAQARTLLEQTRALYVAEGATRAQFEHSIAALIGKQPAEVNIEATPTVNTVPTLDAGIPSSLLERRPDIASAERTMQSSNALIGVAVAAYYPDFSFSPSITFVTTMLGNLLQISNAIWSIGPSLAGTALDGGARAAQVEGARATYDKSVATYRQTVITAFQQVEDSLAQQHYFEEQEKIQRDAVDAAREAVRLSINQYQAGTIAYTTVITAQTTAIGAEQTLINIRLSRFSASATLVTALGGGWRDQDIPALIPPAPKTPPGAPPVKKKDWWAFWR